MKNKPRNFCTAHSHPQSLDSASTPEAFVEREKELSTGHVTVTDHGTLQACRRMYEAAKGAGIVPILGMEAYLRDDDCPILKKFGIEKDAKGTFANYQKYMHLTMHFLDQEAYEAGVRILSKAATSRVERHGSEEKALFAWADLEELGGYNVTFGSGCLIGAVQRHLLADRVDIARAYYEKVRSIVKPGNFLVEVFPHKCDKYWVEGVFVEYEDGSKDRFFADKKLRTSDGEIRASELAKMFSRASGPKKTVTIVADSYYRKWREWPTPKTVVKAEHIEDFIQNECTDFAADGDTQRGANLWMLERASEYGDLVLVSDDSHFTRPEEKVLQDIRLRAGGGAWRFYSSYHRQTSEEALAFFKATLGTSESDFERWVENSYEWADRFRDFKFVDTVSLPTSYYPSDTLAHTLKLIKEHGRINFKDRAQVERLQKEIEMIHRNGKIDLLPYFFVAEELNRQYVEAEELTGPGRGSAAGLLLSYGLGITHVNPLEYQLSMERFLTADRIRSGKMPDIDQDLPDRGIALEWLEKRFPGHYAQISVDTTLKVKSAIRDVARVRYNGTIPPEINSLVSQLPDAPQGISDRDFVFGYKASDGWQPGLLDIDTNLQTIAREYPKLWDEVTKLLGLTRQKGRHASAYVIMDVPVSHKIPLQLVSGVPVTSYTAAWVEKSGGIKMDYLVVNSLKDIGYAIKLIQKRKGLDLDKSVQLHNEKVPRIQIVPHAQTNELLDIWKLPEDQAVFREICEGKTDSTFQFGTPGAKKWLRLFNHVVRVVDGVEHKALDSIEAISAFTALDRPGPLDYVLTDEKGGDPHNMLVEYSNRAKGKSARGALPILNELFPETFGVITYQEQLQKAFQVIGGTTGVQADEFRVHISKKQMAKVIKDKEIFMPGAIQRLGEEIANELWNSIETFGQYGFNKSHATCYAIIGYACQYLKHYYPVEWWTAVLRNADKNEINDKFWALCGHLIDLPDVNLSSNNFVIINDRIRAPVSLLDGIGAKAQDQISTGAPYKDIEDFIQKDYQYRVSNGSEEIIPGKVTTYKNGRQKVRPDKKKLHLGHSPLHRGVVSKLVVTGAMESLFPPDLDVLDQLKLYEEIRAKVYGEKQRPIDKIFIEMNALMRFQMRKDILPAYSEKLLKLIGPMKIEHIEGTAGRWYYRLGDDTIPFVPGKMINTLEEWDTVPEGGLRCAVAAYVISAEVFEFTKNGAKKKAFKAVLDIDGFRKELVRWQYGKIPLLDKYTKENWEGAIVIALLERWSEKRKDFSILDLIKVQPPLNEVETEQSP